MKYIRRDILFHPFLVKLWGSDPLVYRSWYVDIWAESGWGLRRRPQFNKLRLTVRSSITSRHHPLSRL